MTYPTVSDLKSYIGVSASTEDTPLTKAINGAIATFERATGRVFVSASSAKEFPVKAPFVNKIHPEVLNTFQDFVSVSAVTNGDGTSISTGLLRLYSHKMAPPYYQIWLEDDSGYRWSDGGLRSNFISITAHWGYSTACPNDVFLALLELAHYSYRTRSTGAGGALLATGRNGALLNPAQYPQSVMDAFNAYRRISA